MSFWPGDQCLRCLSQACSGIAFTQRHIHALCKFIPVLTFLPVPRSSIFLIISAIFLPLSHQAFDSSQRFSPYTANRAVLLLSTCPNIVHPVKSNWCFLHEAEARAQQAGVADRIWRCSCCRISTSGSAVRMEFADSFEHDLPQNVIAKTTQTVLWLTRRRIIPLFYR